MNKKINLFIVGVLAVFGFAVTVQAKDTINLDCVDKEIQIGASTTCTVSISSDNEIKAASFTISTSQYLEVSNVVAKSAAGWTASTTGTVPANGLYAFNNGNGSQGVAEVFSFTLTVLETAKGQLDINEDCGQICISAATFDGVPVGDGDIKGTGTCFSPIVIPPGNLCVYKGVSHTEEECEEGESKEACIQRLCPPETGDFMNYAIIIGTALIAVAAVVIARKSSKFYRV